MTIHTNFQSPFRARDKGSIQVKYPQVLSKHSIIFKNLGIATQLILFPNSRVKIKVSRSEEHMITILYYDYCTVGVFILHMINLYTIIKLIGYNGIPCFKYLNQAFCCALCFCFISFTQLNFILGGIFTPSKK